MPVIARFYGMTIKMYLLGKEHNPPHIHALYGDYNGIIDIQTLDMMEGDPVSYTHLTLPTTCDV